MYWPDIPFLKFLHIKMLWFFFFCYCVWYFQCAKNCEMAYSMWFSEEALQCKSYHAEIPPYEWDFVVYIDCVCNSINYNAYLQKKNFFDMVTRLFLFYWLDKRKKRCLFHCLHANGLKKFFLGKYCLNSLKEASKIPNSHCSFPSN